MRKSPDNENFPDCWVRVAGLDIHYKCLGQGPPVVLLHGGGNDWHEWIKNLDVIARDFQVFALDLPGFGASQAPDTTVSPSWYVMFLKNFLDSLGITRTHLIGHSISGMISIAFAVRYPDSVNKLVIVDASGLGKISQTGWLLISIFRILDRWKRKGRGLKTDGPNEEWLVLDKLPEVKNPVLIVWGQNDIYLPVSHSRLAHSLIPDSRLCIFPHCGHAPQRNSPDKFNNLIMDFLNNGDPKSRRNDSNSH